MTYNKQPSRSVCILAPTRSVVPEVFQEVKVDRQAHAERLAELQRLRGGVYLEDGAIEPWQLTVDGRHCTHVDASSWHLLSIMNGQVIGCARLQVYAATVNFSELGVAQSAQAYCATWGAALKRSVTSELERARRENLKFIEAGGWALAPELRCTTEALHIALGSYALGELLGGCLGVSTATVRHQSASILQRLGGSSLSWDGQQIPSYYDPVYRCEMEVVRFDSRLPSPKFTNVVDKLQDMLLSTQVLCEVQEEEVQHDRHS